MKRQLTKGELHYLSRHEYGLCAIDLKRAEKWDCHSMYGAVGCTQEVRDKRRDDCLKGFKPRKKK